VNLTEELQRAGVIATEAGDLAARYFRSESIGTREKGPRDVVTAGDLAAEELLRNRLAEAFPLDGIVGEEGTAVHSSSGRRWYLDPIDGTLNFSRGLPIWCVSLALFDEQGPLLGIIRDPTRGDTFRAARGQGADLNGKPLTTSGLTDLDGAVVHITVDFNEDSMHAGLVDLANLAPRILRSRNIGSAALALAYVSAGYFDAMVHRYAHTWDYAAGVLLIQEAGGRVTDMAGRLYSEATVSLVAAASRELASDVLDVIEPASGV
jgi:myo-inositol-1(or 4)-monophosphatase